MSALSILDVNLKAFLSRYPKYQSSIDRAHTEFLKSPSLSIEKNGAGFEQLLRGPEVLDSFEPSFTEKSFKKLKVSDRTLFLEGFGLGSLLLQAQKLQTPMEYLFVLEPSTQRLIAGFSARDWTAEISNPKIHWYIGVELDSFYSTLALFLADPLKAFQMDCFQFIEHPVFSSADEVYFSKLRGLWDAARELTWRHFGTSDDSLLGLENSFRNLGYVQKTPGIDGLENQFADVPAVVVSTGPSLPQSLSTLKALQNKCLLISVDTSLNILRNAGVEPHFVLTIERDGLIASVFERISTAEKPLLTQLITYPVVPPAVLEAYKGPSWIVYRNYPYYYFFEKYLPKGILPSGTSVAHMAAHFAAFLGCPQICLVGQDLSFDPKNFQSHSNGYDLPMRTSSKNEKDLTTELHQIGDGALHWVEGNLSEQVPTSSIYRQFIEEFSILSQQIPKSKLINSTEGGAKIPLVPWIALPEVSKNWETLSENIFERALRLREIKTSSIDFSPLFDYFLELSKKLSEMKAVLNAPAMLASQRAEVCRVIRLAILELRKDNRFMAFVLKNAGYPIVPLENRLSLFEGFGKNDSPDELLKALNEWLSIVLPILARLQAMRP